MVTSRFELENEIERQFGQAVFGAIAKEDSTPGIAAQDVEMRQEGAEFYSQQATVNTGGNEGNSSRYQELKRKFESASKNQYKFTPTFSQNRGGKQAPVPLKRNSSSKASLAAKNNAQKNNNTFISPDQIARQQGIGSVDAVMQVKEEDAANELASLP